MSSSLDGAGRICGEQDCNERIGRPNHPLCYDHYTAFQVDLIDECPNHPGVYKPSEYPICRSCYSQRKRPAQASSSDVSQQPQDDSRGWNRQPTSIPTAPQKSIETIVEAIAIVLRNIRDYEKECVNQERNTIQYLVRPMLRGLGWDFDDPKQVVEEFKPTGKQRYPQARAVDIALLDQGDPEVFIEVKRLDRQYAPDYEEQLAKYASYLHDGGIAVLTNGRHWHVHAVSDGKTQHRLTIDIADGDAESVAREIHKAIGRDVISSVGKRAASSPPIQRQNRPETAARRPGPEAIAENLRQYREIEAWRRSQPAYTVFNNETIELIAAQRPADLRQLGNIKGIGPSTLQQHGDAIIRIVRGVG